MRLDRHLQAPGLPGLLDALQLLESPLGGTDLRRERVRGSAVRAAGLAGELARRRSSRLGSTFAAQRLEARTLAEIPLVGSLVRGPCRLARLFVVAPRAGELANTPGLALELDDPIDDRLKKCAVVGDDDDRCGRPGDEAFEQAQPVEVEVVRRLVEEQHVVVRLEDLPQRSARSLAPGEPCSLTLLGQVANGEVARAARHSARVRLLEPGEHAQERRLAGAVRADDADSRPRGNDQRDAVEHDVAAVALRDRCCGEGAAVCAHARNLLGIAGTLSLVAI